MLIGHEKLTGDFKELAAKNDLSGSYLFFGQPRIGKKLFAVCLANFLEKREFEEPKILSDFLIVEPDIRGTIGIEQARELKNFLWRKPAASPRRTAVINDSEAMTAEAQNAILKIAEEPPESSLLIIIARDPEHLWPTLLSRLQKVYFASIPVPAIEKWLLKTAGCGVEEAKKFSKASYGQPGLAWVMASDEKFGALRQQAERFLKSGFWDRRNIIKSMMDDEKFNISKFLEIIMIILSENAAKNSELWHRVSALRRDSESYNINPRLQLEGLLGGV